MGLCGPLSTPSDSDIWIYSIARGTSMRLTFGTGSHPVWSADASAVEYTAPNAELSDKRFTKPANGTGVSRQLISEGRHHWAMDPQLLFDCDRGWTNCDIAIRSPDDDGALAWVLKTEHDEKMPVLSPDGRWMAYVSNESGNNEVYIRPYPDVDTGKWLISRDGGRGPRWSPDGGELFYTANSQLMSATVSGAGVALEVGEPTKLFDLDAYLDGYDVSPDGQRFLFIKRGEKTGISVVVVENLFDELNRLVPHPD